MNEKLKRQIQKTVREHYDRLSKVNNWYFSGDRTYGFYTGRDATGDFISFDIHPGGSGDHVYRWVDSADVLFPKLKKLTGAKYVTVGVLGDLSNEGGINVTLGGIRRKR